MEEIGPSSSRRLEIALIEQTLRNFDRLRQGEMGSFPVELEAEDGSEVLQLVDPDNVDSCAARYQARWEKRHPDLFEDNSAG